MPPKTFDLDLLGCIADDFESLDTICGDVSRRAGRLVSEEETGSALLRLVRAGLVDVFLYHPSSGVYEHVDPGQHVMQELWFMANAEGRAQQWALPDNACDDAQ